MASSRVLVVVNPVSGNGSGAEVWKAAAPEVRKHFAGVEPEVFMTTGSEHGAGWVAEKLRSAGGSSGTVLALGGDGTLSEVARGFFGKDRRLVAPGFALGLIPVGRGNDFFKTLAGMPGDASVSWRQGMTLIQKGAPHPMDVGFAEFTDAAGAPAGTGFFINILDFGFPGLVVHRVVTRRGLVAGGLLGRTKFTYLAQSVAGMLEYKSMEFEIKVDGREIFRGPLTSGLVLNGRYNAGGVCWSKTADPGDGVFEVLAMKDLGVLAALKDLPRMKSGEWESSPGATAARGKVIEARMLAPGPKPHPLFDVDGDLPEGEGAVAMKVSIGPQQIPVYREA